MGKHTWEDRTCTTSRFIGQLHSNPLWILCGYSRELANKTAGCTCSVFPCMFKAIPHTKVYSIGQLQVRPMLYTLVCGMWYVVCCMWYVVCGMWYVVCCMYTIGHILHTTYHIPHTTYHIPHTTYYIPHTTYHIPHTTYHIPHTTYHIPHTKVYSIGRTWSWPVMYFNYFTS